MKFGASEINTLAEKTSLSALPLAIALEKLGPRWTLLVLDQLHSGPKRFHQLRALLPWIPAKSLARALDRMEHNHLILRTVHLTRPPRVTYSLLQEDPLLHKAIQLLSRWGSQLAAQQAQQKLSTSGHPSSRKRVP